MTLQIIKSITVGSVGAGLTYFRYPRATINLMSQNINLALGIGVTLAVGSLFAETLHSYVFPHIHFTDKMSDTVSSLVAGGACATGSVAVFYLSDPRIINDLGMGMIVAGAFGSEMVGDYVYRKFIHNMVDSD